MVIAWWPIMPVVISIPLYAAGGLTFPILAYFVVEGYRHTSNLKKYMLRIFIFGAIAAIFHPLVFSSIFLNIMFTIIMGLISLILYDKMKIRPLFWVVFVILCLLTLIPIQFDWAIIGIIVILLSHIIRDETKRRTVPAIVGGLFMLLFSLSGVWAFNNPKAYIDIPGMDATLMLVSTSFIIGCIFAALLLKNYSGERGRKMKWFFYVFYPLHLAVLGGVAWAMGIVDYSAFRILGL